MSEDRSVERLSVGEAADALGVTRDAIDQRIRRGTIEHEQGEDGSFYVYVDTAAPAAERSTDVSTDDRTDILIAELQDRIRSLEEANRENRRIIAALTQRIPVIEAPQNPPAKLCVQTTSSRGAAPSLMLEALQRALLGVRGGGSSLDSTRRCGA